MKNGQDGVGKGEVTAIQRYWGRRRLFALCLKAKRKQQKTSAARIQRWWRVMLQRMSCEPSAVMRVSSVRVVAKCLSHRPEEGAGLGEGVRTLGYSVIHHTIAVHCPLICAQAWHKWKWRRYKRCARCFGCMSRFFHTPVCNVPSLCRERYFFLGRAEPSEH